MNFVKMRSRYVSPIQKKLMLKYLQGNPELLNPKVSVNFKYKDAQIKWAEMANMLNRVPGSKKDWKQWKKTWHDMRSKTKMKHQQGGTVFSKSEKIILGLIEEIKSSGNSLASNEVHIKDEESGDESGNEFLDQFLTSDKVEDPLSFAGNNRHNIILEVLPSECSTTEKENPSVENGGAFKVKDFEEHDDPFQDFNKTDQGVKGSYYQQKLKILYRIAKAKEKSAAAKERIAQALEKIAESRATLV